MLNHIKKVSIFLIAPLILSSVVNAQEVAQIVAPPGGDIVSYKPAITELKQVNQS